MAKKIVVMVPDDVDVDKLGSNFGMLLKKAETGYSMEKYIQESDVGRLTLKPVVDQKPPTPEERETAQDIMADFNAFAKGPENSNEK